MQQQEEIYVEAIINKIKYFIDNEIPIYVHVHTEKDEKYPKSTYRNDRIVGLRIKPDKIIKNKNFMFSIARGTLIDKKACVWFYIKDVLAITGCKDK